MSHKLLIVDDAEKLAQLLADELEDCGYEVETTFSGKAAMKILESKPIDLVISDVRMPNGDGVYLIKTMKERNLNHIPLIFISGFNELTDKDVNDLGAVCMMKKPIDEEYLIQKIEECLRPKS